jgi:hypothetical protein
MLIFFFGNNQNFQDQALPFFVYQFGNQKNNNSRTHFFYVYIVARSRIQQEHYLMILCSTIQEDARNYFF